MTHVADWIMRAAAGGAPAARSDWAEAMRAEYAELEHGRLSWALGCWLTATGWRLRADLGYFAALGVTALALPTVITFAFVWFFVAVRSWLPRESFYVFGMMPAILASLALGAYRPKRILTTVLVLQAADLAFTLMTFAWMGAPLHSPMDVIQHLHIMDLPFLVGYSIWIVTDLAFAWLGGALRQRLAPIR